jgi:hypothetical protein
MDPTRTPGYKHHGPLTERLLQFLHSLRKDGWLVPAIRSPKGWLETLRPVAARDLHQLQGRGNFHFRSLGVCHHEDHHPNTVCQLTLPSPTPPLANSKKPERMQRPPSLTNKKGRNVGSNGANGFRFLLHP